MKRGRVLSLFLSIILIASAIVPCLQMSVNANAAVINEAIDKIKTAWNQLEYDTLEGFHASRTNASGSMSTPWTVELTETTNESDKAVFGSHTTKVAYENLIIQNENPTWLFAEKEKTGDFFKVLPYNNIKDVYINVSSNKPIKVKLAYRVDYKYMGSDNKTKYHNATIYGNEITIPGDSTITKVSGLGNYADFKALVEGYAATNSELVGKRDVSTFAFVDIRLYITDKSHFSGGEMTVGMGKVVPSIKPTFPADLEGTSDLMAVINAAEDALAGDSYSIESKAALQTAVDAAWEVVKNDKALLIKAMQLGWNNLLKTESAVLPVTAYNKTGTSASGYLSINYDRSPSDGSNYVKDVNGNPLNDPAHSGLIKTQTAMSEADVAIFGEGNKYAELKKAVPPAAGSESDTSSDIPSLTVGDVILTKEGSVDYRSDCKSLYMKLFSTKSLTLKYRVWYYNGNGKYSATGMLDYQLPANTPSTLDLRIALNGLTDGVSGLIGVAVAINSIDGNVTDTDYFKISDIIGTLYDTCPSTLQGNNVALANIYGAASKLDFDNYVSNADLTRFKDLVVAANNLIKKDLDESFKDKDKLIKIVTEEVWPSLVGKNVVDVKKFNYYNSTGDRSQYSERFTPDGSASVSDAIAGQTDAENSGTAVILNSSGEQVDKFGSNYVRLTTTKYDDGTNAPNKDYSNDIPYLDLKSSVVITPAGYYSTDGMQALTVTVNSSMDMTLGCRMWFGGYVEGKEGFEFIANNTNTIKIKKGYNTIDLMPYFESRQKELQNANKGVEAYIAQLSYIAIGIKEMSKTPDSTDYLEIGNVRANFNAAVPKDLKKDGVTATDLYDAMKAVNLDDYLDGDAKERFNLAFVAAKEFADQEWEEACSSEVKLADLIKNKLWGKLVEKAKYEKQFRFFNRTGKSDNLSYETVSVVNSEITSVTPEQKSLFGNWYWRLTNKTVSAENEFIPYLGEESAFVSYGAQHTQFNIKMDSTAGIYLGFNASMAMSVRMRIWYNQISDSNGNGKYDDWAANEITFTLNKGENRINLREILDKQSISPLIYDIHYIAFSTYNYEHPVGDSDFLEVGSVGHESYAVVPKKLSSINSLSAIIRVANNLNMDDYVDNDIKTMFMNAVKRGNDFLAAMDVNLSDHVPIEVYETDISSGKRAKLGTDKFGYDEQRKLADGNVDDNAVEFDVNNKKIDIIFNLNDKMKLFDVKAYLEENNVKSMTVYASATRDSIWDESGMFYQYDGTDSSGKCLGIKSTDPAVPVVENQYIRFSFDDVDGDVLKVTEIECIGKGVQQLAYSNVIEEKRDVLSLANVNYNTKKSVFIRFDNGKFGSSVKYASDSNVANDGDLSTVVDFLGGSRDPEKNTTYNIVINLNGLFSVDNIKYYAGSNEEYFPRHMKFYLGYDEFDILDNDNKDTVCVAEFTGATADKNGLYEAKFLSQNATYARIEVIEDGVIGPEYGDNLLAVVKDIQVNGLNLNATDSDVVRSFTDEESGIIVDIMKNSEGDIFETVQGMKLTKRKPTDDEVKQSEAYDFTFKDWFYTVTFIDYKGDPVYDVGGREIRVSVPVKEDEDLSTAFMATLMNDKVVLLEHSIRDINDVYYITVNFEKPTDLTFAGVKVENLFVDDEDEEPSEEESSEEEFYEEDEEFYEDYEDEDYEDEDYEDEEEEEEEEQTSNGKRKKYYKVIRKGGGLSTGAIVGVVSGSTVAVAGGALMIIFRKKIFKPRIKVPKV